jgi:hypothetical protein
MAVPAVDMIPMARTKLNTVSICMKKILESVYNIYLTNFS